MENLKIESSHVKVETLKWKRKMLSEMRSTRKGGPFLDTFQTLMKVSCGVDKGVGPPAYMETF